jgi:hypothetical protein
MVTTMQLADRPLSALQRAIKRYRHDYELQKIDLRMVFYFRNALLSDTAHQLRMWRALRRWYRAEKRGNHAA